MDWRCDLSSRAPALQLWSSEFKPQSHQKQTTNKENNKNRCMHENAEGMRSDQSSLIKVNFESNIEENSRNWKRRGGKQCIQVTRKAQASKQSHVIVIWRSSGQWPLEAEFCYIYRGHLFSCIPNTSFCGTLHLLYLFLVLASWITWNLTPVHSW
jgi:hypothetical protein